ncbi:MAG: sialidase family protein [Verrucomicrobia bacterium]|nr:sialidase family protein [Verrucomicrobiota bacterium]
MNTTLLPSLKPISLLTGMAMLGCLGICRANEAAAANPGNTALGLPAEGMLDSFLGAAKFDMQQVFKGDRFPNVVVATDGTVLAFWNGVKVRRSEDAAKTWGDEIMVGKGFMGGGVTVDENSGDILAFVETKHTPQALLTVCRSTDHGKTWRTQETVIHPNKQGNIPTMHMNEHGITLRHGKYKGRLLRATRWFGGSNDPSFYPKHYADAIHSDDGGKTWQTSEPFPAMGTGEATLAELADGRIYYNSRRHWDPKGDLRCRWSAWSDDGGETWKDCSACRILPDGDQCSDYGLMGGLVRLPIKDKDILLFSNIESPTGRHHGTVWASFDGGKTWPLKRLVFDGPFAYSSLDAGRPGTPGEGWIFLQFENGEAGATVARFNLGWLLDGEPTGDGELPQWLGPPRSSAPEGRGNDGSAAKPQAASVEMAVNLAEVQHQMAGGVGASWHSISREMTFDEKLLSMDRTNKTARGSGWGANPPVEDVAKWTRVEECASWLGLDWLRVELQQRSYQPERDRFDWSDIEMQALYRILDWCERNKADVFLTQMYSNVEWNAYEGVSPVQSAPKNMDDFAVGLATLVEHLVNQRKYTCIKWICITNEPAGDWSWWLGPGRKMLSITPGLKAVRGELDKRGLRIPLSAPDWNHIGDPPAQGFDFAPYVGAYDSHDYGHANPIGMGRWVKLAHAESKPFFLSEMGNMWLGWGDSNPGPRSYAHGLSLANTVLSGMNTGVDGFNRWSFTNRGDLDGQWQLVRTWDSANKKYLAKDDILPEPVPYYAYAMLTRFSAKHSAVLKSTVTGGKWPEFEATYKRPPTAAEKWPAFEASYGGLNLVALRSPKGNLTFIVLNKDAAGRELVLRLNGIDKAVTLHCYQVTESEITRAAFKLDARKDFQVSAATPVLKDQLPPSSITVYSTYSLKHSDAGVTTD